MEQQPHTPITGLPSADGLRTRVIIDSGDRQQLTFRRTTDSRTAIARGLAEYLSPLQIVWEGGRQLRFENFELAWAEPEVAAKAPAGVLVGQATASYEAAEFTPFTVELDDGRVLRAVSEMQQTFSFIIYATDPRERMGLVAMVEDAMNPADFMTGLRLELPFYFGARATYELLNLQYDDNASDARRRWRRAVMAIQANVPQFIPVGDVPRLQVSQDTVVEDGIAVC